LGLIQKVETFDLARKKRNFSTKKTGMTSHFFEKITKKTGEGEVRGRIRPPDIGSKESGEKGGEEKRDAKTAAKFAYGERV